MLHFPDRRSRRLRAIEGLRGFSLIEISLVLIILGLALGAGLQALGPQLEQRRYSQTQQQLQTASDALWGFFAINGRLPCPASMASNGQEVFTNPATGQCANPYDGIFPAAALGLSGLGPIGAPNEGQMLDSWNRPIRYAVNQGVSGGGQRPYTVQNGIKTLGAANLDSVTNLRICATQAGSSGTACAIGQDIVPPAYVLWSTGDNGLATSGADEAANLNGDPVFVSRARGSTFDDLFFWLAQPQFVQRLIQAGSLP